MICYHAPLTLYVASGVSGGHVVRGTKWQNPAERVSRASSIGKEMKRKIRRASAPPPPMLSMAQWEAAAEIGEKF